MFLINDQMFDAVKSKNVNRAFVLFFDDPTDLHFQTLLAGRKRIRKLYYHETVLLRYKLYRIQLGFINAVLNFIVTGCSCHEKRGGTCTQKKPFLDLIFLNIFGVYPVNRDSAHVPAQGLPSTRVCASGRVRVCAHTCRRMCTRVCVCVCIRVFARTRDDLKRQASVPPPPVANACWADGDVTVWATSWP